jgi:hypothetical protein
MSSHIERIIWTKIMSSSKNTNKQVDGMRQIIINQPIKQDYSNNIQHHTNTKEIKRFMKVYRIPSYTLEKERTKTDTNYILSIEEDKYEYLRKQMKSTFSDFLFIRE